VVKSLDVWDFRPSVIALEKIFTLNLEIKTVLFKPRVIIV
jgi:hypothetical protein